GRATGQEDATAAADTATGAGAVSRPSDGRGGRAMGKESRERLDQYRRSEAGEVENTLIDELVSGELDRSEFLRRATVFGLSTSVVGTALAALGEAPLAFARSAPAKAGGRIKV